LRSVDCAGKERFGATGKAADEKELSRAKTASYRYLTVRSLSRKEIEQKLVKKQFRPEVVCTVVEHLIRLGYINDAVFAAQWASSRARSRSFGRRRIEQELYQKGIDKETVREALGKALVQEEELQIAQRAAEQKIRTMKNIAPEARRRRLAGFLERKGFSYDIIRAMLPLAG
jgi:regulatory protein